MLRLGGCEFGQRVIHEKCTQCVNGFQPGYGVCPDCGGEGMRRYRRPCTVDNCATAYCSQEKKENAEKEKEEEIVAVCLFNADEV